MSLILEHVSSTLARGGWGMRMGMNDGGAGSLPIPPDAE